MDDLKNMGLKAYDLIWLEGKSAAWRYPSEIEELKPFAPVVEEQPFDRFYRRPVQVAESDASDMSSAVSSGTTSPAAPPPPSPTPQVFAGEPSAMPGKRIIYVTMPAGRASSSQREPVTRETARESSTREPAREPSPLREPAREPAPLREPATRVTVTQEPTRREYMATPAPEDYSAQSSGNDDRSVEYAPHFGARPKNQRRNHVLRPVAIAGSVLILLSAGIFIGYSLSREGIGLPQKTVARLPETTKAQPIVHVPAQQTTAPAGNGQTGPATQTTQQSQQSQPGSLEQNKTAVTAPANTAGKSPRITTTKPKEKQVPAQHLATLPPAGKDSAINIPVVQREAIHRSDVAADKPVNTEIEAAKSALATQVSVGSNSYSVGTFGGINDLQLTVINRSSYPLDLVVVEVSYIQANKKVYKTENLYFRGIGAGSALMQEAPRSSRGVKVQYRIINISSKELGLSYSGI